MGPDVRRQFEGPFHVLPGGRPLHVGSRLRQNHQYRFNVEPDRAAPQKQAAYNTSKGGVVNLTRSLAAEWADRGVRVNCISPGIVRTPLIMNSPDLAPLVDRWLQDIPMGRLCELKDLQGAAVFLASEVSDYMTGHNLVIEGGHTLW